MKKQTSLRTVFVALFAAFIASGAFIAIPVGAGGIPIVLQNLLVILTAVLLGGFYGSLPTLLFLVAGALGLPIFSGGTGGIAKFLGPTGGFLYGYFIAAFIASLIAGKHSVNKKITAKVVLRLSLACIVGFAVLFIPGIIHFMILTHKSLQVTLASCVIPFLPGDVIKLILTIILGLKLRPVVALYLYPEN